MTTTAAIADFLAEVSAEDLPDDVQDATKQRVYDTVGVALGGLEADPVQPVLETAREVSGEGPATFWGADRSGAPPQAAMVNATLTRVLDFLDSFRAPSQTAHPSETVAPIVACGEAVDAAGADLLAAVAAAYQLQGELAWEAPIAGRGFDHVTHTVLAGAAGAAKVMGLDREATANAIAIAGAGHNALGVTRRGTATQWQDVAGGNAARNGAYAALLASEGLEGPRDLFEGEAGWSETIAGDDVALDLDPECPRVTDVMTKRYLAAIDVQSAVEACIELSQEHYVDPEAVTRIRLSTFDAARFADDEGEVRTRTDAERSLRYMVAVAILDCSMGTDQFEADRIQREDVQDLLECVVIETDEELTERFERGEMPARVEIELTTEDTLSAEKETFAGHPENPMDWEQLREKFANVSSDAIGANRQEEIEGTIRNLEERDVSDLAECL